MTGDISSQLRDVKKIRRRLPRTWRPFFGRFGSLTEVQRRTIPAVLQGSNVVVGAPTASGKTEAIVAPVVETQISESWPGLAVIYVVPTRALANDMFARLEGSLDEVYLKCVLKHGEHSTLPTSEFHWLITTPESLDSLICRKSDRLENLRTVIVDEIHSIDRTYRGDQMRVLLERLRRIATAPLSVHLLSATIRDPISLAQRYVSDFQVVMVGEPRTIQPYFADSDEEILELAKLNRWRKLLYFCNSRRCVEETAEALQKLWSPYPVVAHHGSLDRDQRLEAEQVMKQNSVAVCVATSTLEIGIDIGDIDLVVLAEAPWSLEALLQRVGRGSRRSNVIQAAAICHSEDERELLGLMFEAAERGDFRAEEYNADCSVIVQQILSLLFQYRSGLPQENIVSLLNILGTVEEMASVLNYLVLKGYCHRLGDEVYPTTELLDLADEGKIHSNIPDQSQHEVVNVDTGRRIGQVIGSFDQVFLLAGQSWRVVGFEGNRVLVRRAPRGAASARFGVGRNVGQFHYLLPPEMRSAG